jgi:hypothetical protein
MTGPAWNNVLVGSITRVFMLCVVNLIKEGTTKKYSRTFAKRKFKKVRRVNLRRRSFQSGEGEPKREAVMWRSTNGI